jgi:glutamate synthase (NADPH/NADH) small chain
MSEPLTRKERMAMARVEMPEEEPAARAATFDEVNLGLTTQMARLEAMRCLECRRPTCIAGCPVGIRIDEFIVQVAAGDFAGAGETIRNDNLLPAICGRVCPQEHQCEGACVLARKDRPIAIGHLERFVADITADDALARTAVVPPQTGHRVAVIGSGPAGLACAADLIRHGHEVTVFEALHEPGGVLTYGIPEFRLPKSIVAAEIRSLESLGVTFEMNTLVGATVTLRELTTTEGFDAVFIGVGAGLPRFLDIPGEHLVGVYSANEFLTRVNLMKAWLPDADTPVLDISGQRVAVFGGGNTAMDAVRTALRLGAAEARIVYRRSADEMPARAEEVHHAEDEGVIFEFLAAPLEFLGDEHGRLTQMRLQAMELGEPDDAGRRRPVPIDGATEIQPVDLAIVAIGNAPNPLLLAAVPELDRTDWGTLVVDEETGMTSMDGVFAGGDIVTGGATVILAMGAARKAAAGIHGWLSERTPVG